MQPPFLTFPFILLVSIEVVTIIFSLRVALSGINRYRNTDRAQKFLRKSVKYFSYILVTIATAGICTIIAAIYFLATNDGIVSGYLYCMVTTSTLVNIFDAWQFQTYLLHPERRIMKYPIGICSIISSKSP